MNPLRIFLAVLAIISACVGAPLLLLRWPVGPLIAAPFLISATINVLLIRALDRPKRAKKISFSYSIIILVLTAMAETIMIAFTGFNGLNPNTTLAQINHTRLVYGITILLIGIVIASLPWLSLRHRAARL